MVVRAGDGFRLALVAALVGALAGCASDPDAGAPPSPATPGGDLPANPGGSLPPSQCAVPDEGCSCVGEGSVVPCGLKTSQSEGLVHCALGERSCKAGRWGACEPNGQTSTMAAPEVTTPGLGLEGLGNSTKCVNNPCDPYCNGIKDDYTGLTFPSDGGLVQSTDGGAGITLKPNPNAKPSANITGFRIAPKPSVTVKVIDIPLGQYPVVDQKPQFTAEFLCGAIPATCNPPKPTVANWTLSSYQNLLINNLGQVSVIKPIPNSATVIGKAGGYTDVSQVNVIVDVLTAPGMSQATLNSFAAAAANPASLPADDFNWLYPYKNTLFPRGLTAPVAQTDFGSLTSALVKYTLRHRKPDNSIDFSWSTIAPQSYPPRYSVPQHVWQFFDEASSGQGAELVIQRAAASCNTPANCQDAFFNGRTYRFCSAGYSWDGAKTQCQAMGMNLASINSQTENDFIGNTSGSIAQGSWWVGLNDQAAEGNYVWSDGSPYTFSAWNGGEPNNSGNEDCAEFMTGNYRWNDLPCGASRYFVCEGAASSCSAGQVRKEVVLPIKFSSEPMQGTVYFWEINNGRLAKILDDGTLVQNFVNSNGRCLACHSVSADGTTIVAQLDGGNGNGGTFNALTGQFLYERGGANQIMGVSPDGYWALWNDWGILSPTNSSQRPAWAYYKGVTPDSQGRLVAPAWSPDGKWLAWTRWDSGSWYVDFNYANLYITPFNDKRPIDYVDNPNCTDASYGGHLYRFCRFGADWNGAQNYCQGMGMNLASAQNQAEADWMAWYSGNYVAWGSWWIGLSDQAVEGQYKWADGSPYTFPYWNAGEPNNSGNEDCTEMYNSTYRWNDLPCNAGRYFVCEGPDSWNYFGNNTVAAAPQNGWDTAVYPSFSPDSNYVIFQYADAVRTRGHYGRLHLLNRADVAQKVDLANANTPTSMAANGATSVVANQDAIAYEPTFSPNESGGYYWSVFISNRWYGNLIHPTWGTVKPGGGHLKDSGKKQMWVTAIPKNPNMAADTSSPPFWLPGQQLNNENMRGFFAKTPCKQTNQACKWDEDCCGNANNTALCVLDQPVTPAATRHCGSFTPGVCVQEGASCTDSSQCCQSPKSLECIQGVCIEPIPTPFYAPTPYTRDYDGTCPDGTRVVWKNFSWKASTPGDSSITVSVQTGETLADLNAAVATPLINFTAAQCNPWSGCGDVGASLKVIPSISKLKLRVTMMLNPTSDAATPPLLTDWNQEYDCMPSE